MPYFLIKNNTCSKIFHVVQMKYMTFLYCLINILLLRISMSVLTYHVSFWIYVKLWVRPKLCGNYVFPQDFHIRKLGEILLFYAVIAGYHVLYWFSAWFGYKLIKPFHIFGLLLYPQWSSHVNHADPLNFLFAICYCCGGIW